MYFVGVDLAWGIRQPTGLAAMDADGRLVHVSAVRTDEEIVAALAPYVEGDCLVAIDAPLIVTNPTGNRPAEAALNRDFAPFDAGAHPANTGKPEFRDGTRGAGLCAEWGLDLNPRSRRRRRALEVYPHPATIALFGLGRILKYKNKKGRDVAGLQAELARLMNLLAGLATAVPPLDPSGPAWEALREQVAAATRKSELRVVEDQVDALLCAYVALFATRRPELTTTYGDPDGGQLANGYIVTPTLPPGLRPTPRVAVAAPSPEPAADPTREAVREYAALQPRLREATDRFALQLTTILDDAGINYLSVAGRAKSVTSFATKAGRLVDGRLAFADPLVEITDQIGVRVITYVHGDVAAVADLLADQMTVCDDRDLGLETASEGRFGYASRHLLVELEDPGVGATPLRAQVQIRTVLQHAWAEFEHDIRYKGTVPDEHAPDLDRRFTLAAGLLELADREFTTIRDRLQAGMSGQLPLPADEDPRISPRELAAFLAGQYADASWSRTDHYAWIAGLLLELGITSLAELADVLRPVDSAALNERMGYRYPPGAVRRLDDALLAAFGETFVTLRGNAHREAALRERLGKLVD